jgi:hypothetical protein
MIVLAAMTVSLLRPAWTSAAPASADAPVWRKAAHEQFANTDVSLLEDGSYLYVAFEAAKDAGVVGDAVTLYLWSDKAAYRFSVDAHGVRSSRSTGASAPQWSAREHPLDGGYRVVMRFPEALFSGAGQSRWLVQFAREIPGRPASTWPSSSGDPGNVLYASAFDARARGEFTAARASRAPKIVKASQAQQLWTQAIAQDLPVPAIPPDAQGVAVAQTQNGVHFIGVDAESKNGTEQNAQSLGWTSADGRASAGVERISSTDGTTFDLTHALCVQYDNRENVRFSAGVATDRGTNVSDVSQANYGYYDFSLYGGSGTFDMRWNFAGPQFGAATGEAPPPGTAGYTLSLSRAFGNVSLDASANRYRDDFGNLSDASERAAISAALSPAFTFDVDAALNAATQYGTLPYAQLGTRVDYAASGRRAAVSYHEDHFQGGLARETSFSAGFTIPALGILRFAHRQTARAGTIAGAQAQQSSSADLLHRLGNGSVSLGYLYGSGASNVTFSFEDRLPVGLLRATYYQPNTPFSAPNFSLKLVNR